VSVFNPDFWEVFVERTRLESFANEDALWHEYNMTHPEERARRARRTRDTLRLVNELIRSELTSRQRESVRLYYFSHLTEQQIAERLGIPQQVVSQHLHGIMRNGRRTGGAIPKLRKICKERGITW
jgi:RNA polymerase sigma factor (sigma-70 family)